MCSCLVVVLPSKKKHGKMWSKGKIKILPKKQQDTTGEQAPEEDKQTKQSEAPEKQPDGEVPEVA